MSFISDADFHSEALDPSVVDSAPNLELVRLLGEEVKDLVDELTDPCKDTNLVEMSQRIQSANLKLLAEGVSSGPLTRIVAALNELLTYDVVAGAFAKVIPSDQFCWVALGSQARYEQTFTTDQDNGIVFADGLDPEKTRELLIPIAKEVNVQLDACGFALCDGDIMASNPAWCLSLSEWKQRFGMWIDAPKPQALLHGSIFFDFRPLYGASNLVDSLRSWLARRVLEQPIFLRFMAENALQNTPPLGRFMRRFRVRSGGGDKGTLDIKINGVTLFTDAARIFGLASGVVSSNTTQRLRESASSLGIEKLRLDSWVEAFSAMQTLRLRHQFWQHRRGEQMDNWLDPQRMTEFEQGLLEESLRQAKDVQKRLAYEYQISR